MDGGGASLGVVDDELVTRSLLHLGQRPASPTLLQAGPTVEEVAPVPMGPALADVGMGNANMKPAGGLPINGPVGAISNMLANLDEPITPALLPRPTAARPRAPRRGRHSPVSNPRRSRRLASSTAAALGAVARAQKLIMQKLGIETDNDDAMTRYTSTFDEPLSEHQINALTALAEAKGGKKRVSKRGQGSGAAAQEAA
ncbi:hypothetical protein VPH35_092411 [Triticum aestivum]